MSTHRTPRCTSSQRCTGSFATHPRNNHCSFSTQNNTNYAHSSPTACFCRCVGAGLRACPHFLRTHTAQHSNTNRNERYCHSLLCRRLLLGHRAFLQTNQRGARHPRGLCQRPYGKPHLRTSVRPQHRFCRDRRSEIRPTTPSAHTPRATLLPHRRSDQREPSGR